MSDDSSSARLAHALATEITRQPAGERVASSRELVARFGVSASTVAGAMRLLTQVGLVELRPGAGAFRAAPPPILQSADTSWQHVALATCAGEMPSDIPDRATRADGLLATLAVPPAAVINLNGGYLHPTLQPERSLMTAIGRAGRRVGSWTTPPVEGIAELRDWFARDIGGTVSRSDVLICSGGQAGIALVTRALSQPGEAVVVESPCYPGILAAVRAAGAKPIPVPVDGDGIRPDLMRAALRRGGARLVMLQPLCHNPTGVSLAAHRRAELIAIAREHGAFLVEDDFARYLRHADAPPAPEPLIGQDPDGVVIHLRSLTKATSPNLRVGAIAARGPVFEHLRAAQVIDSFFVSRPLQEAALEVVSGSSWHRHLRTLGSHLADRRAIAVRAIRRGLGDRALARIPDGGYHLWLELPPGCLDTDVVGSALRRGVAVTAGRPYFPTDPMSDRIRISYCAAATASEINQGIELLGAAVTERRS